MTTGVPPEPGGFSRGAAEAEGGVRDEGPTTFPWYQVSPSYFETLAIPLVAGRTFTPDDADDIVIVSADLARRYWPEGRAIGRRFRLAGVTDWCRVVGIAGTVETRAPGGGQPMALQMYWPWAPRRTTPPDPAARVSPSRRSYTYQILVVRADRPADVVPAVKAAIWAVDPRQPVENIALASRLYDEAFGRERFVFLLMTIFAGLAVALSAVGLFGLLSQAVVGRRREIGVRVALGAAPADIVRLVMGRGLLLSTGGLVLGLVTAAPVTRYLESVLFTVSPRDALSFAFVPIVLVGVTILACWLPTRAALGVDPARTLRAE